MQELVRSPSKLCGQLCAKKGPIDRPPFRFSILRPSWKIAINYSDGDRAAKIIQDALGIDEGDDVANYSVSENMARRPRAARSHYRRVAKG